MGDRVAFLVGDDGVELNQSHKNSNDVLLIGYRLLLTVFCQSR
jgi:hypothetical protein